MDAKKQNIISISVSIAISIVVFFYIIRSSIIDIKKLEQSINQQQQELEKKFQNVKYLKKNASKLKEIEDKLTILDELFIIKEQELSLITKLEAIAEKNHIEAEPNFTLSKTKEKEEKDSKQKTSIPIEIKATGTTENIIKYLLEIEQLNYYINFKSVKINSKNTQNDNSQNEKIELKLEGDVYLLTI